MGTVGGAHQEWVGGKERILRGEEDGSAYIHMKTSQ
jgi:hypothetical protein